MSDFSRITDDVVDFIYAKFGGKGVLKTPKSVREFLEQIESLLLTPHIRYVLGESTASEPTQDYMDGMMRRFMEVEQGMNEALDDLHPHGGGITRHQSRQVSSRGDLHLNQSVTGKVDGAVIQIGSVGGSVHTRGDWR